MDDYITGVEQVGVDPTTAVETVETQEEVKTHGKVDPDTKAYEFEEFDLKEYGNKEFLEKSYGYDNYDDVFGQTDANPTSVTFEEDFGPGSPAETDIRESSVSATAGQDEGGGWGGKPQRLLVRNVRMGRCGWCDVWLALFAVTFFVYCFQRYRVIALGIFPYFRRTPPPSLSPTDKQMSAQLSVQARPLQPPGLWRPLVFI